MKPQCVDLVLLVDSSQSMSPCFAGLQQHLADLLAPLHQVNFKVRFGLVAYNTSRDGQNVIYSFTFVNGDGLQKIRRLYSSQASADDFFTEDGAWIAGVLGNLVPRGDEDTLLALDVAADFPFGPLDSTRRVIALFTDEKLETGILGKAPIAKIPELIEKLQQRRIQLFIAAPLSPGLEQLAAVDRAEVEAIEGGDGLKSLDFAKLLAQMGKSISVASLQTGAEPAWKKALFGQDRFGASDSAGSDNSDITG